MLSARSSNTRCLILVLFVLTSANGSLHHHVRTFGQRAGIFCQAREANDAMPFGTALPVVRR